MMILIRLHALMAMQICCILILQYFHFNTASLQTLSCLILYRGWFHGVWKIDFKCKHHNSLAWAGSTSVCNKCHVHTHWNKSLPLILASSAIFLWAVLQEYRIKTFLVLVITYLMKLLSLHIYSSIFSLTFAAFILIMCSQYILYTIYIC